VPKPPAREGKTTKPINEVRKERKEEENPPKKIKINK
jgi:hypothetical protein